MFQVPIFGLSPSDDDSFLGGAGKNIPKNNHDKPSRGSFPGKTFIDSKASLFGRLQQSLPITTTRIPYYHRDREASSRKDSLQDETQSNENVRRNSSSTSTSTFENGFNGVIATTTATTSTNAAATAAPNDTAYDKNVSRTNHQKQIGLIENPVDFVRPRWEFATANNEVNTDDEGNHHKITLIRSTSFKLESNPIIIRETQQPSTSTSTIHSNIANSTAGGLLPSIIDSFIFDLDTRSIMNLAQSNVNQKEPEKVSHNQLELVPYVNVFSHITKPVSVSATSGNEPEILKSYASSSVSSTNSSGSLKLATPMVSMYSLETLSTPDNNKIKIRNNTIIRDPILRRHQEKLDLERLKRQKSLELRLQQEWQEKDLQFAKTLAEKVDVTRAKQAEISKQAADDLLMLEALEAEAEAEIQALAQAEREAAEKALKSRNSQTLAFLRSNSFFSAAAV